MLTYADRAVLTGKGMQLVCDPVFQVAICHCDITLSIVPCLQAGGLRSSNTACFVHIPI